MNHPAPLNLPHAPAGRTGQGTEIEKSRAGAEVFYSVLAAKQSPRYEEGARAAMQRACQSPRLAERAFFRYSRAGKTVNGPSVHLARELARCWGNIQYGIFELRRDDIAGESEMQAFAWDLETNARNAAIFIVPHRRDTKNGPKLLVDQRDIYENNANNGARRVREAIFAVLPVWYVEEAQELCMRALAAGGGAPVEQRAREAVARFAALNVTEDQLAARVGRPIAEWTSEDLAQLTVIYRSLQRNEVTLAEEFAPAPAGPITAADITPPPPDEPKPEQLSPAQNRKMHALFREADITDRDQRLRLTSIIVGREVDTSSRLNRTEAKMVIDQMEEWAKDGHLADHVDALLHGRHENEEAGNV